MANYERRVYEPSDEVRVFDGSEEDDDVEGSRLPLLIVLALLVLAMFAGVVWLAYTQGVARGRGETPILTAANGPEKVAPQQAGGTNVPYQGFKIYEQPAPPDDAAEAAPVDAAKPAAPPPVAQAPKPAPVAAAPAPAPVKPAPVTAPPPAPKVAAAPAKPAPAPAKPAPAKTVASLIQQSQATPPPAMKPAVTAPAGPATGSPRALGAPVATTPAPAPVAAKPAAAGGAYVLQIGAFKSQAEADTAWRAYKGKHAALLTGYNSDIQQADLGEKGTWYRLRIAGFGDREVASALCDRLKADGGGCFLGR
jgi:outer membrane biosynthesis protein TonB